MTTLRRPETQYARSGDTYIAYQVVGDGPIDLVHTPGAISHLEATWELPSAARYLSRLAASFRVVLFDKRGTGMSDRTAGIATLEERMDDIRAVMDAAGVERAALMGISEGGPMSALFAATYPERTSALILYGSIVTGTRTEETPWAARPEEWDAFLERLGQVWGTAAGLEANLAALAPSRVSDDAFKQWFANYRRLGGSPGAAIALNRMNRDIDIRGVLPAIRVPTLVLNRSGDGRHLEGSRFLAAHIAGAKFVELPGTDHMTFTDDAAADAVIDQVIEFLTGVRPIVEPDRVLATVLFTDIVGSTERAAALGDHRWREVLEGHHGVISRELVRHRGREVDTAGDGVLAVFDGPARGIRCAAAAVEGVRTLGLEIRAGLHTGEVEMTADKIRGIAVHIGARIAALGEPGEILVSSTVKDLVVGSGIGFDDRGTHVLKGVPGEWRVFAVRP